MIDVQDTYVGRNGGRSSLATSVYDGKAIVYCLKGTRVLICNLGCILMGETLSRLFLDKGETVEGNPGGQGIAPLNLIAAV